MKRKILLKDTKHKFNKTYSMQFRILATVIFAMLAITVFMGGISMYEVDKYVQGESENFFVVTCDNERAQIDNIFEGMKELAASARKLADMFEALD